MNKKPKRPKKTASLTSWEAYQAKLKEFNAAKKRKDDIIKSINKNN